MRAGLFLGLAILAATVAACRSTDPAFYSSDGRLLKDMTPLAYRVAVAPLDTTGALASSASDKKSPLEFSLSDKEMHTLLVRTLRGLHITTEVVPVASTDAEAVLRKRADLLVIPRLTESPYLRRSGRTRVALATTLWFTTWIGGLYVDDKVYDARMAVDFDVVNVRTGDIIASVPASSNQIELSFFERNGGGGTAQALIIPPSYTTDKHSKASAALSEIMTERMAGHLTRYFKENFTRTHRNTLGELRLSSPRNRADVGPEAHLQGLVLGVEPVTELTVYLNNDEEPIVDLSEADLPDAADQRRGGLHEVKFDEKVKLKKGRNRIQFELRVGGRLSSRTIVVFNGKAPKRAPKAKTKKATPKATPKSEKVEPAPKPVEPKADGA